jgi:hypothetical protein
MAFFSFWKPLKRIAFCTMVLAIVLLIGFAIWNWRIGVEIEQQMAFIRSQGHPALLAELATPPIDPDDNALTFLNRALADANKIEHELETIEFERGQFLSEEDQKRVKAAFDAYPNTLPLLRTAADCKAYRSDADFSKKPMVFLSEELNKVQTPRIVARVLQKHIALLISQSKFDEAANEGLVLLKIADHVTHEPTIVQYLVSNAVRGIALSSLAATLQRGAVSKDVRLKLERELSAYDDNQHFAEAIISERAFGNSMYAESPWSWWRTLRNGFLKSMQKRIDFAKKPYGEFKAAQADNNSLSDAMVAPALNAGHEASTRNQALSRTLRVLNAIQSEPSLMTADQIDTSSLSLPADATIDPFTEQPLVIRKQGASWLIYSLGFDLKDDGGEVDEGKDVGIAPLK